MKAHPEKQFIFRLARELGMTKSRLLAEADSREIAEWIAYFLIENEAEEKRKLEREGKAPEQLKEKFQALMGGKISGNKSGKPADRGGGKRRKGK